MPKSFTTLLLIVLTVTCGGCAGDSRDNHDCAPHAREFVQLCIFVDEHGDDAWDGTVDRPFQTIARAQQAVRAVNGTMTGDVVVLVAPGEYFLTQTLQFTEADSGSPPFRVIYKAAGAPGSARIIGGFRVSNWTPYSGNIYRAQVKSGAEITTLFEDGVRADEARYPHRSMQPMFPQSHADYLYSANQVPASDTLIGSSPVPVLTGDLSQLKLFIWPKYDWFTDIVPVDAYDPSTFQFTLAHETRYPVTGGSRYFIEGALSLLGAPGEFFHDATNGYLYFWPRATDIYDQEIIAPTLLTILSIKGISPDRPVHDLRFEGLTFEDSNFVPWYRFGWPKAGQSGEQHLVPAFDRQIEMEPNRRGMVTLENTRGVELVYSRFRNSGLSAIYLLFSNVRDLIYGSLIEHAGINGIALQGRYPGEGDDLHDNVISNDLIRFLGEMAGNAAGVGISNGSSNEVSFSEIHDSPRYGIAWGAGVPPGIPSYVQGNSFKYLRISDVAQDSGDTAAAYAFSLTADLANVRANTLEQVFIFGVHADPSMLGLAPIGVYMDNDSPGQVIRNVLVENTAGPAFFQHSVGTEDIQNVSWESGFDESALDLEQIGLRADFPPNYLQ